MHKRLIQLIILTSFLLHPASVRADWPTVGHDPQRTSYAPNINSQISEGGASPSWYKEIPSYMPSRTQLITVNDNYGGTVYVASAGGLYALNSSNGNQRWFYPTSMPVGNSPAVVNDVVYLPVMDKTIHAINASNGQLIWQTDTAGAGFYASPLVVNNKVYIGNRDGFFYAFNTSNGSLAWNYPEASAFPEGYISQAAATNPDNSVIYFADTAGYAYALDASNGNQLWKTSKFPGAGFHAFWPVYYDAGTPSNLSDDRLILSRTHNYAGRDDATTLVIKQQLDNILYSLSYLNGKTTISGSPFINWLQSQASRQTVYSLNPSSGSQSETPPILMWGNNMDNHYPPALSPSGRLYFMTAWSDVMGRDGTPTWFGTGRYGGWTPGTTNLHVLPNSLDYLESGDEPEAISIFGGGIFHNDGGDGVDKGGIGHLTGGQPQFWYAADWKSRWSGFGDNWPNYKYGNGYRDGGGWNNIEGTHGIQNAPVPLGNRFFFHRSNNVVAYSL